MNPDHLIALARTIALTEVGNPRQVSLKRAVSTAYYALFHALCQCCVDATIGRRFEPDRYWAIVTPMYRAIEHASAKRAFDRITREVRSSGSLKDLGHAFVTLQEERVSADYDPGRRYRRPEVLDLIDQADEAIAVLRNLSREERAFLAVHLITKPR